MAITIADFGIPARAVGGDADALIVRLPEERYVRLTADGELTPTSAEPAITTSPGPFALTDFGATRRLVWPAGGCGITPHAPVAFWGEQFAAIVDEGRLTVVDASSPGHTSLVLTALLCRRPDDASVHAGRLAIACNSRLFTLSIELLESLRTSPDVIAIEVRYVYPLRRPAATARGHVAQLLTEACAIVQVGTQALRLYLPLGLEQGMDVVMHDEMWPGTFAAIDVPGRPRQRIYEPESTRTVDVPILRTQTRDPAATGEPLVPTERQAELDHLLAEIARDPDTDAHRAVLVDLLQDLGAPYGTWLAQQRGPAPVSSRVKRRAALGPLGHYLAHVEYLGGLPWTATFASKPPTDPELVATAAADLRLGMLSALRLNSGPIAIYRRLISSPRALGLRRVDAPDRKTLACLIASGRDQLTHLYDLRFVEPAAVELLADPAFDRAVDLDTIIRSAQLGALLDRIAADHHRVFARVERRLVLRERHNGLAHLAEALQRWNELPLAALTIGLLTVRRANGVTSARLEATGSPPLWIVPILASTLPELASIELAQHDETLVAAIRSALPRTEII